MSVTSPRRALRRRMLSLSIAAVACAAASSGVAFAADSVNPGVSFAMQRDLGIMPGQIAQYTQVANLAHTQDAVAQRQLGASYAGSWIERNADGTFKYVVAAADGKSAAIPGADVRQVRYSMTQLETAMTRLDNAGRRSYVGARVSRGPRAPQGVHTWSVDPRSNAVVLGISADAQDRAIDFVAASGADAGTIRFDTMASAPVTTAANIYGGLEYVINGNVLCSIGFAVKRGSESGFISAGHCGKPGNGVRVSNQDVGAFVYSNFPTNDASYIRVNSDNPLYGLAYMYNGFGIRVLGSNEAGVGAAVCRSGRTTHWQCGSILSKGVTVNYAQGAVYNLTESNACVGGGDSGGSFITEAGQAQGTTSGGTVVAGTPDTCGQPSSQRRTYYQPVNPVLQGYGVALVKG